jgi:hypothetical protein
MSEILLKSYGEPPYDIKAACRYAGGRAQEQELALQMERCFEQTRERWSYRVCYRFFDLKREGALLDTGFAKSDSKSLSKALAGCDRLVLFAATVGSFPDRMALRYGQVSPYRALLYSALGSERVESLCDLFEKEMRAHLQEEGLLLTPRFSPGYGDLPLSLQREIFEALQVEKYLGVRLNDSLLMWPCKSVTAMMGIKKAEK